MATKKIYLDNALISQNTSSYNDLYARPSINGVTLQGEITSDELNLYNKQQVDNLIASSRSVKIVPTLPATPLKNTQYYVGPNASGKYHVYIYDNELNRIDLGSNDDIDFSIYQDKLPTHTDASGKTIYDIGHNEGETDNKILVSHTVTDSINEIDTLLSKKQNAQDNTLTTNSKKVVDAINELNTKAKDLQNNVKVVKMPHLFSITTKMWCPIATITITEKDRSNLYGMVSANFIIAPAWEGAYASKMNQYNAPVGLNLNVQARTTEGFLCNTYRPLTATFQNPDCSVLRYNEADGTHILVTWNNDKLQIWYYDLCKSSSRDNLPLKLIILDQDIPQGMTIEWAKGSIVTNTEPSLGNSIKYTWKQLGYRAMSYS